MAIRIDLLPPKSLQQPRKILNHPFSTTTLITNRPNKTHNIPCAKRNLSDTALALDLAVTVEKINTHLEQKEKAMKQSREFLFTELCQYLSLKEEEVNKKWRKMKEEEKWVLVKGFVNNWGVNFHPLSVRSVVEMVDEYLQDEKSSSGMFPGLKRMLGFSQDT
ncbi:hypothetical protein QUC31_015752 [Theobroma cacao]|uniref:Uncharacterized protein LOC18607326 n=2 Tax=Theobroma cacao TaxID=3641 RepID=A0AB32VIR0_THECC|nr:PREDICTED: uncharacterized protein LOC18607326 [Theobroma cacao]EOX97312.1 Uncharacterized protein TCM_006378 [Theobroma cacao]WRX14277.1 hypothetical protein QQP08_006764 [Theobroma cacao]